MSVSSAMEVEQPAFDVSLVQQHYIPKLWPTVAPLLERATERNGRHEVKEIYDKLMNDGWHLWVVFEPDLTIVAACVTIFAEYPTGLRVLQVQFLGGDLLEQWVSRLSEMLDSWGRANNCQAVEFTGRRGWVKVLKPLGYQPISTIYQRNLEVLP